MSRPLMALLSFAFVVLTLPLVHAGLDVTSQPLTPAEVQTKTLADAAGNVHILWVVPGQNGSYTQPGIWYSKYSSNGTSMIAPTRVANSTTVQSAEFAIDHRGNAVIVWADDNASQSQVRSSLVYLHYNSTAFRKTQILAVNGSLIMWPTVAVYDDNVSHLVWTQYEPSTRGAWIEYGTLSGMNFTQAQPIASYDNATYFPPKAKLMLDTSPGFLHVAWGETHNGSRVDSTVDYARLISNGTVVSTLEVSKTDEPFHDISVTLAPGSGGAFLIWQTDMNRGTFYAAQISYGGRLLYLKQLSDAYPGASILTVSTDSQNNLYIVWLPSPLTYLPSEGGTSTLKVGYLMVNSAGDIVDTESRVFRGPLIAATVSGNGDVYALTPSGLVVVVTPSRQLIPSWLVTFTLLGCIGLIGAFTTEEARYRLLSISPVFRSKQTAGLQDEVVRMLQRKPGMKLSDIKRSAGNLGFGTLLPLERQGVIFSTRDGLSRRFYAQRTNENSNEFLSGRILSWILEHPMTWEAQVAKELGLSQQLVHYHLKRLHAQGLLTATLEANGNRKLYRFSGKK